MDFFSGLLKGLPIVGDLVGGHLDREAAEDRNLANQNEARYAAQFNADLQREFAKNGIRWRVEDAKAAGLHPLFALGGAGATASPAMQVMTQEAGPSYSQMGQNLSRAAQAFDPDARAVHLAQLKALEAAADKDFATASAMRSEAARTNQAMLASIPPVAESFPVNNPYDPALKWSHNGGPWQHEGSPRELPPVEHLPDYITQNIGTLFTRYNSPWGEILLPSKDAAESLEALDSLMGQIGVTAGNVKHYGKASKMPKAWSDPSGAFVDWARSKVPEYIRR